MPEFFLSLPFELGFPCPHKEIKHYISESAFKTWREGFNAYLRYGLKPSEIESFEKSEKYFESDGHSTQQTSLLGGAFNPTSQTLQGDGDSSEDDFEDNENLSDDDEFSLKPKLEINTDQDKKIQNTNNDYKGQLHNIIK